MRPDIYRFYPEIYDLLKKINNPVDVNTNFVGLNINDGYNCDRYFFAKYNIMQKVVNELYTNYDYYYNICKNNLHPECILKLVLLKNNIKYY
jgi:hypothetical protein